MFTLCYCHAILNKTEIKRVYIQNCISNASGRNGRGNLSDIVEFCDTDQIFREDDRGVGKQQKIVFGGVCMGTERIKTVFCFIIVGMFLLLSACGKRTGQANNMTGMIKVEKDKMVDETAPDLSGSWDVYYDMWLISRTEEPVTVPLTEQTGEWVEERFDLSAYAEHMDYVSCCVGLEPLVLFSETSYPSADSNDHHCQLKLLNLESGFVETIYEFDSTQEKIHYPTLTTKGIYWLVYADTIGENTGSWSLYGYDMEQKEVVLLREQKGQTMNPCLQNCGDSIAWIEGPFADAPNGEHTSNVYQLAGMGEAELLFPIRNITNPYMSVSYNKGLLSYVDYYDQAWYVLLYELENGELYTYQIENLEEWEFPVVAAASEKYLVYSTYFNRLYAYDRVTGETKQIGNTQYVLEAEQDSIFWADQSNLFLYRLETEEEISLQESLQGDGSSFSVMRHMDGKFYTVVTNFATGEITLVVYTIP